MDKEYTIENCIRSGEFTSQYGTNYKYTIQADGETGELSQKPETPAPKTGDKLFGHFEDTPYGKRFKKARQGFGGFKDNPQRQSSIEWQSARRDAIDYCIAKSRLLFDLKKNNEAEEELSGKHIFEVAFYFKGIETGATQLKDKLPEKQIDEESEGTDPFSEEIDINDINIES